MKKQLSWSGLVSLVVLVAAALNACSKDESPLESSDFVTREPLVTTRGFLPELDHNSAEDRDARLLYTAYASDQPPTVPQAPFPVLYLLHDYLGDAGYFEKYSLQALVDEMYAKGEIGRMLVVTVDASNFFGGSYYRNSATMGRYEDLIDATIAATEQMYHVHTGAGGVRVRSQVTEWEDMAQFDTRLITLKSSVRSHRSPAHCLSAIRRPGPESGIRTTA